MNETKNNSVKALKKQMAAAVAMVCVAAVRSDQVHMLGL